MLTTQKCAHTYTSAPPERTPPSSRVLTCSAPGSAYPVTDYMFAPLLAHVSMRASSDLHATIAVKGVIYGGQATADGMAVGSAGGHFSALFPGSPNASSPQTMPPLAAYELNGRIVTFLTRLLELGSS